MQFKVNLKAKRRAVVRAAGILGGLVLLGGAFYGGVRYGAAYRSITITDSRQIIDGDFSVFWDTVDLLKSKFLNGEKLKDQDLLYGAVGGAVDAAGDPYTVFLNPSDAKKFDQDLTGSFGGIGAEIGIRKEQIVVVAPLKGNPAEAAGLKAGDKILKVDETETANLVVEEAVKLIRGEPGTKVKLLILREGWDEAKTFTITRQVISAPTVDSEMRSLPGKGDVLYLQLHNFNANAPSLFYDAVVEAFTKSPRGMVLDLRNNPGGYLDIAVHFAGWFLDHGEVVVKERFRGGSEVPLLANGNEALSKMPVVVLVNGGSASASEILAGALRDDRGVKLVGEQTFGKGSVQEVETLADGSTLKVTIAEWLTPAGHQIDQKGLTPDFEVKGNGGEATSMKDLQLEKALEVLASEISEPTWSVVDVKTE
ncbi:MAG: S41 family peptidase [Candidatus Jorgensenbacteria bacterium]